MRYQSQIGVFPILENVIKEQEEKYFQFLKEDYRKFYTDDEEDKDYLQNVGGFVFPKKEHITSHDELFSKYQLFINRNGINKVGRPVKALSTKVLKHCYYVQSREPIFVGDPFREQTVSYAEGTYLVGLDLWDHIVTLDTLDNIKLPSQIKGQYHPFHEELIRTIKTISDEVVALVESIKTDIHTVPIDGSVLSDSTTNATVTGSIHPIGVTLSLIGPKKKFQNKMNEMIKALEKVKT